MVCPNCGETTKVVDSRPFDTHVWRRRECTGCLERFNTIEILLEEHKALKAKATELKLKYGK